MKLKLLLAGIALLFVQGQVLALDPLVNYDNFNKKKVDGCKYCINPELWRGLQRGDRVTEILREIKAKRAHLFHRSWNQTDSNSGGEQGRNRLNFRESETISGACFTPRIKKYEIKHCDGNIDSWGQARIRYLGAFYDTNTAEDSDDGVVYAAIEMRRGSWANGKKGRFEVSGWVEECGDADCTFDNWSTYDDVDDPDLVFKTVKGVKNKGKMCLGYDWFNHEIVFSYNGDERRVNSTDHGLPAFANRVSDDWAWHVIETRTDVPNCMDKPLSGSIEAEVDDVKVRYFGIP